jgi:hypothetical protein
MLWRDGYKAEGPEAKFEAGSRSRVLRNRLGIKSVREIERKESEALLSATEQMIDETRIDQCFTPEYLILILTERHSQVCYARV